MKDQQVANRRLHPIFKEILDCFSDRLQESDDLEALRDQTIKVCEALSHFLHAYPGNESHDPWYRSLRLEMQNTVNSLLKQAKQTRIKRGEGAI